jgi:DNA helicase-2/ATP-dependent DNA helicase PcrA
MSETSSISQRAAARLTPGGVGPAPPYLDGLNPEQREAVLTLDGPLLVLAGAGTGKTRALTARLAHILATRSAWPSQILVVTFTNKAAREMRERARTMIGPEAEGMKWLGTFHSICAQMLRQSPELAGLKPGFTIIDADDQQRLIKQILEVENIDQKRWPPRRLAGLIDSWKNRALTPDRLPPEEAALFADGRGGALYALYQQRLSVLNCADFGDLLLHVIRIWTTRPETLEEVHRRFRYILVDEYQDTNVAQYLWLRLLARGSGNICCVGDDDQSIYGWRGAEVENILRFDRDFPGARIIRLETNYRSTGHILASASSLISCNGSRLGKTLRTEAGSGDPVRVRGVWDGDQEARLIADDIAAFRRDGRRFSDCAVLVRASWQMRAFEERFIITGTPYRVIGGPRFFERAEIRDAIAYLRLIRSPFDDLAFERVVNQPRRGIGESTIQKLQHDARERGRSLVETTQSMVAANEIRGGARAGLARFLTDIDRWRSEAARIEHSRLLETVLEESGYTDMLQADKSPQSQTRLENLKELVRAAGAFDSFEAFLEHVELVMDAVEGGGQDDQVQVLTLHSAKGLEWPVVFLPGWEEEVFPSRRSLDEQGVKGLEEERRLAYVGLTRARETACISFAANRQIYGRWTTVLPSRFIDELPEDHVETVSETGYAFDGPGRRENASGGMSGFQSSYDSPGWKRAQAARRHEETGLRASPRLPDIEASGRLSAPGTPASGRRRVGERIFHQKFGYGRITEVEGAKLTVAFDKAGLKKVVDSFVEDA